MGSVASTGFSLSNLLQGITSGSPQLSATLSSSTVQSALQDAPSSDLVELSSQALQLQEAHLLFSDSSTADATPTIPAELDPLSSVPSSSSSGSTAPLSDQLAGYQSDLKSQEMESLFGVGQSGPALSTLFDVLN
jgi:hypothetical protein